MPQAGIILIGGGGHAKVVYDTLQSSAQNVRGFLDDRTRCPLASTIPHLGPINQLDSDHEVILAIGDIGTRQRLLPRLADARLAGPVIHETAVVSSSASLGEAVFVGPGAIINADARFDRHAIINSGAIIEHDCRIGYNTHIAPAAALGGAARIGDNTLVGIGARILPGIEIGSGCTVGAGAVVTRHVPDNTRVVGTPARILADATY